MKRTISIEALPLVIFLLIGLLVILGLVAMDKYWHYYYSLDDKESQNYPAPPECFVPFGMVADGDVSVSIFSWHDMNANGVIDDGEPPLAEVLVREYWDEIDKEKRPTPPWDEPSPAIPGKHDWGWIDITDGAGHAKLGELNLGAHADVGKDTLLLLGLLMAIFALHQRLLN